MKSVVLGNKDVKAILEGRKRAVHVPSTPQSDAFLPEAGDIICVKETYAKGASGYEYLADCTHNAVLKYWHSPYDMPLEAARIFLKIKDVTQVVEGGKVVWMVRFERVGANPAVPR